MFVLRVLLCPSVFNFLYCLPLRCSCAISWDNWKSQQQPPKKCNSQEKKARSSVCDVSIVPRTLSNYQWEMIRANTSALWQCWKASRMENCFQTLCTDFVSVCKQQQLELFRKKKVYASELLTEYRSHRNFSEKRKRKILLYFCLGGCINTCICSWCVIKL